MILSDVTLNERGKYLIDPFDPDMVQPASIDLHLDNKFLEPHDKQQQTGISDRWVDLEGPCKTYIKIPIDPFNLDIEYTTWEILDDRTMVIEPGQFILGSTIETVKIPNDLVGQIEGKSSLARLGLFIHVTAGFCDPGFEGKVTLEIYNVNPRRIILKPGMKICQIAFAYLDRLCARPYGSEGLGSHYQGQTTVTGSRYAT